MKKLVTVILILLSAHWLYAQCYGKQYHSTAKHYPERIKILYSNITNETYTVWGTALDTSFRESSSNREIWIIKNDACNNTVFKTHIGFLDGNLDDVNDAILTPDTGLLLLGYGESVPQGGQYNITLFKLNKNGIVEWQKAFTTPNRDITYGSCITLKEDGSGYIIGGQFTYRGTKFYNSAYLIEIDLKGNLITQKKFQVNKDSITNNDRELNVRSIKSLADSTYLALIEGGDDDSIYIAKFDRQLNMLWIKRPLYNKYSRIIKAAFDVAFDPIKQSFIIFTGAYKNDSASGNTAWRLFEIDNNGELVREKWMEERTINYKTVVGTIQLTEDRGVIIGIDFRRLDSNWNIVATYQFVSSSHKCNFSSST